MAARYNRRQVMKDAHSIYGNSFQRKGRTWSECLKAAWSWEKRAVRIREEKAAALEAMIAATWMAHNARMKERQDKKETWSEGFTADQLSYAMGYNRGSGSYCGD